MKKIVLFIFTILISILLVLLALSFSIKSIVVNTINSEIVSKEIASKVISYLKEYNISDENMEKIETNILNSDNTYKITEKYVNKIVDQVVNNDNSYIPSTKYEIKKLLEENESYINDMDIYLTENQRNIIIDKLSGNTELGKMYNVIADNVNDNITVSQRNYITLYTKFISKEFKLIISSIIVILIIIIGLIKNSMYKWMINLSISSIISGLFILFLLPMFVDFVVNDMLQSIGNYEINLNYLMNFGYIYIGLFAISILVYLMLDKLINNKENILNY